MDSNNNDEMMDYDNITYSNGTLTYNDTFINCANDLSNVDDIIQILYFSIFIIGIIGNSLVIYVIGRFSIQTVTNVYILNLAIADECFLLGIPFLTTTMRFKNWIFGNYMCKGYMIMTGVNQFTSSIFLLIMSADRYLAVCHPISSSRVRTSSISKILSLTVWTTSILFMTPVILYADTIGYKNKDGEMTISCNIFWPNGHDQQTAFILYTFILSFVVPLICISIFYYLVIKKLQTVGPIKERKRHRRVTRIVAAVIAVYVVCWSPYWIFQLTLIYTPPGTCQSDFSLITFLLANFFSYANSALNPVLYAFLSDNFKKSFLRACACVIGRDVNELNMNEIKKQRVALRKNRINANRFTFEQSMLEFDDEEGDRGKTSTTTMTMTSRSNVTTSELKDLAQKNKDLTMSKTQLSMSTQV